MFSYFSFQKWLLIFLCPNCYYLYYYYCYYYYYLTGVSGILGWFWFPFLWWLMMSGNFSSVLVGHFCILFEEMSVSFAHLKNFRDGYNSLSYANILVAGYFLIEVKSWGEQKACACLTVNRASHLRGAGVPLCKGKNKCKSTPINYIFMNRKSLRQK